MIKLLPYDSFVIRTSLSTDQIIRVLEQKVETRRGLILFWDKPYKGSLTDQGFKIIQVMRYRTPTPVVVGKFQRDMTGLFVSIQLRPRRLTIVALFIWLIAGAAGGLTMTVERKMDLLAEWVLFVGGSYFLTTFTFLREARKTKIALLEWFQGQEIPCATKAV